MCAWVGIGGGLHFGPPPPAPGVRFYSQQRAQGASCFLLLMKAMPYVSTFNNPPDPPLTPATTRPGGLYGQVIRLGDSGYYLGSTLIAIG